MTSASFVLAINIAIGLLFASAFTIVAYYDPAYRSARWFAGMFLLGALAVANEVLLTAGHFQRELYVLGFALYLASLICMVAGLLRRYAVKPEWMALAGYFALAVGVIVMTYDSPRDSLFRLFSYQVPMAGCGLISAYVILRYAMMRPLEWVLAAALVLGAANVLAKPFIALAVGGPGASPADYAATQYAAWSQTIGGVIALTLGVLLLLMYAWDIVEDMREAALTDGLSGLLYRRGFSQKAERWLHKYRRRQPASLIVIDLDHFKTINKTYGHAAGDSVIEAFSRIMKVNAGMEYILCRAEGEEFMVFVPRAGLAAGERFAESLRERFQHAGIADLPTGFQATASFGVTEIVRDETLDDAMQRADGALYDAKRSGRNRVVAVQAPMSRG